jgi:hypothetical protein
VGHHDAIRLAAARGLFEKARDLAQLARSEESRVVVAELVALYEHDADPEVRRLVCRALFGQAKHRLAEGVDRRVVIVDYRHILHVAERQPPIEDIAAAAIYHVALTHGKIAIERSSAEHREKSAERFVAVERRFGASRDPEVVYWVARSAMSHALTHPLETAAPIYEEIFARYANEAAAELQEHAAAALTQWAERCVVDGQADVAVFLAQRVLTKFATSDDEKIREHVAACERLRERAKAAV